MGWFGRLRERLRAYEREHNFTCDICGREVFGGERICSSCRDALPWNSGHICPFCGRSVAEEGTCLECKREPLRTDLARSALLHEGEGSRLVVRFKRGERYLVHALAELAVTRFSEFRDIDAIVFVPMTARAQRRRGFNQSRLLAEEIGIRVGLPVLDVAEKRRETAPQKTLGRRDRQKNLEGCFHVTDRRAVKGKRLLIADDTLTTGATSGELADTLKRAGAAAVFVLTATSVREKNPFGKSPKGRKVKVSREPVS